MQWGSPLHCHLSLHAALPISPISYGRSWQAEGRRRIATVAAGYADGVPRALTNIGRVRIGNAARPIAGTVCMEDRKSTRLNSSHVAPSHADVRSKTTVPSTCA